MKITPASGQQYSEAFSLLREASLPVEDIGDTIELFVLQNDEKVIGTIGCETNGKIALLRSLSVSDNYRSKGYGKRLLTFLEGYAKQKGLRSFYLLTTTAVDFFSKQGYTIINRADVPAFIQQSSEFSSMCPASATVMKKDFE